MHKNKKQNEQIEKMIRGGMYPCDIIKQLPNVTPSRISVLRKKLGLKPLKRGRKINTPSEITIQRLNALKIGFLNGKRPADMAKSLGISRQRVDQILHPRKHRARTIVKNHVAWGRIEKPESCEECGSVGPTEAHHHDYSKKLDVEWLCKACHGKKPKSRSNYRLTYSAEYIKRLEMNIEKATYQKKQVALPDDDLNGATIRTLRTDAGMPQGVLADAIGCHPSYLSDLERGNRGFSEENFNKAKEAIAAYKKKNPPQK